MSDVQLSRLIAPAFYPVHADVKAGRHRHYWLKGGRGSTKSTFIGLEIILGLMRDPAANAIVYRKVAGTLQESVYAQLAWCIHALGADAYWRLGKSPMELTYRPTGQRVLFRGADDPQKSKSIKLSRGYFKFLWFEELTEFSGMEEIRTVTQSVIRGGGPTVVFYSYNPPKSARAWVNAEATVPRPDRMVHHSTYLDVPPAWLGEAFLAEADLLRRANETAYRHAYLGEATGTGGQVFDNLVLRPIPPEERARFDRLRHGLDFGFATDPDAYVQMHYDAPRRTLYLLREYYATHNSFDRLSEAVRALCGGEAVTADAADPRAIHELRLRGLRVYGAKKGRGSVEHGLRWLQERAAIVIDPGTCPNAAREFAGYEYDRDRQGALRADYPDRDNHCIDAARYGLEDIMAQRSLRTLGGLEF